MTYEEVPIGEFLSSIASESVVPAGGTAAGVVGAIGTSLCEMVCIHTIRGDDGAAEELAEVGEELREDRARLLQLASADADVVEAVFVGSRDDWDREEVKRSVGVPLATAEVCLNAMESGTVVVEKGNRNAVGDAGTGVLLLHAALDACLMTARFNLDLLSESSFVEDCERRIDRLASSATDVRERVEENVERR